MSKSLKNFITIDVRIRPLPGFTVVSSQLLQEILQKYTARQLRLAFLTQLWNAKVDFSESLMTGEVRNIEITLNVSGLFPDYLLWPLTPRIPLVRISLQ